MAWIVWARSWAVMPVFELAVVDRHGEAGPQGGGVRLDHGVQLEPIAHLGQNRHTKLPTAVGDHEIDDFGSHLLGGADEISLVFAVLGVNDDDHLASSDRFNCRVDFRKRIVTEKDSRLLSGEQGRGTIAHKCHRICLACRPSSRCRQYSSIEPHVIL